MYTYLKNMEGWKPKDLKSKSFANIQELFDKAMKRVNTFVDYRTELVEGSLEKAEVEIAQESSSKRVRDELEQESIKKQKVDEDKETTELKSLMEVIPDEEEVAVDAIPLATKTPSIVDWKIHKEGKKSYYQIIRADGSSKMYLVFSHMLKSFNREDLETFYKLVKAKYGSTRPVDDLYLVLYRDLKIMFDPHVKDQERIVGIKRLLDDLRVTADKCISEQIPTQKKRTLGVDQLTKDPSSSGEKDLVFVKSLADVTKVTLLTKSQRNITDPLVAITDSSMTNYDSSDESLVCSTPLPLLKKLDGAEPVSGPKTIKSFLRSKSTFKAETLKGVIINETSSASARCNKISSASKVNLALAGKLKSVKIKDDPPLSIVMKELNAVKL
ncbi:hypothetical protein Tco_0476405 [Tanacetum coccineum]